MKWLAHCLLIALLAAELIAAPFHAHHRDGGHDSGLSHTNQHFSHISQHSCAACAEQATDPSCDGQKAALHSDADDHTWHGKHSVSALASTALQLPNATPPLEALPLVAILRVSERVKPLVAYAMPALWRPQVQAFYPPLFRSTPPEGRAPPNANA